MDGQEQLGRYVLESRLASGGMAEIFLAHQAGPAGFRKEVVVKRILRHLATDQKFVDMFLDEARLAARLSHPNIVQIFDFGEASGDYFIAMEYVEGWDLEAIIDRSAQLRRPIHPAICARIMADACTGLDYAHRFADRDGQAVGLVHRDISPQNIRVSTSGQVKVMDFGIAKARSSSNKTQTGAVKGKLSYMSPEQIMAQDLDGRSDIFALGIVLYELLTGQRPFGHESELLAISAIMNQQPRSVSDLSPGTPAELEQIVLRCLAKDRNQRFQSCSELQMALEQYLRAEGVLLTARDVSEYLRDFFSVQPVGTIAALERSNYGTAPGPDSGVPGSTGKLASGPTRVNHAGGMNTMAQGRVDDGFGAPPPRTRNGLVAVLAVLVVAVLGAGGALFWFVILPAMNAETVNSADATAEASGMLDDATILANADVVPDVTTTDDADSSSAANQDAPTLSDTLALPLEGTSALATAGSGSQEGSSVALEGTAALPSDGSTNALEGTAALPTEGTTPVAEPPDAGTEARTPARDAGSRQPRPPSREVTSTGSLTLVLSSSARVYIDGRERGYYSGSVRIADLPVGRRTIRGVNAEGIERIVEVDIVPGLNRARLNF